MLSKAPSLSAKLGLIFASTALLIGSLFFIYSMKYYFTLAIVLSFSRHTNGNGEGGLNFTLNGGKKEINNGNNNNNNNNILGWLGKVFGVTINNNGFNNKNGNGGLQPNLDNIKLKRHPFISIHVPLYNEKRVVERLLKACTKIKYPPSSETSVGVGPNYEIIVCDDSTDETSAIVRNFAKCFNKANKANKPNKPKIKVLHNKYPVLYI